MSTLNFKIITSLVLVTGLSACGGGKTSYEFPVPPPPPAPVPAPVPVPPPPPPPAPVPVTLTEAATLSPTQEVAETASLATGSGTLAMNSGTGAITGSVTTTGVTATAAHIHLGTAGVNGAVIVGLVADATTPGKWNVPASTTLTKEQQDAFIAGNLYFNVHSAAFPAGEIRGQIGREVALARLSGVQEVEQNTSVGFGLGVISLDPDSKEAELALTVGDVVPTAAHIHTGAIGANGPIAISLGTPTGTKYTLSKVAFTDAQMTDFRAKRLYFNVHSAAFAAGEIRGQIGYQVRIASMTGAQENPPVTTTSTGRGFFAYDPEAKNAFGAFTVTGFTPSAGHLHGGVVGINGPVVVGFKQDATVLQRFATDGLVTLTDADALLFMSGGTYLNAHSAAFPGGEVRGQLTNNK